MKTLMFAYGTLRPGQYNADRFRGEVEVVAQNLTIPGRMRAVHRHGGFPVVDAFDKDHTIVGDILSYDSNSTRWRNIVQMEVGAGYVPAIIQVTYVYQQPGERVVWERTTPVIIWHYPDFNNPRLGSYITNGDWLASEYSD